LTAPAVSRAAAVATRRKWTLASALRRVPTGAGVAAIEAIRFVAAILVASCRFARPGRVRAARKTRKPADPRKRYHAAVKW
jgi:hypothetical protein